MMAIANHAGPQLIGGQLFPKVILVAWQLGMAAVAQMRAQASAGGDRLSNSSRAGGRVTQRGDDVRLDQSLDESEATVQFGRQSYKPDQPAGRVLQALKFIPIRPANVLPRMCPS